MDKDEEPVLDKVDVWQPDKELLPLMEGVPLGVRVELTHALPVED